MKSKLLHQAGDGQRAWALVFDIGDEVIAALKDFAQREKLASSHFTAIGAFSDLTVAYFDWERKKYLDIPIPEQVEVLTLAGDIGEKDGQPALHAHVVVGKRDGSAHGGHLRKAHVRPTLELILTESPRHLQKTMNSQVGLALIDLSK